MKKDKKIKNTADGYTPVGSVDGTVPTYAASPVSSNPKTGHSTTPKKKNRKGLKIFFVILMCILIAGLSAVLTLLVIFNANNNDRVIYIPQPVEVLPEGPEYDPGSIVINDKDAIGSVDFMWNVDSGKLRFGFDQFFGFVNASVEYLNQDKTEIAVSTSTQRARFIIGSTAVEITDLSMGKAYNVEIPVAPFVEDGTAYFYIEDMSYVFSDMCIHYDAENDIRYINFGTSQASNATSEQPVDGEQ